MKKKYFVSTVRRLLVLLTVLLTGSHVIQADPVAQAVWCDGNKTLYFVYKEPISVGGTYDGQTVTQVWSGEAVTNTGTLAPNYPGWYTWNQDNAGAVWKNATTIKFDVSFVAVAPKSLFNWFFDFREVTSITGLNYLDTSQATTMFQMFMYCSKLETIDVSHFDMGMVANVGSMFRECTALTKIYCNQTWLHITSSDHMFTNSYKLWGGTKRDGYNRNISYANPFTGYFTATPVIAGDGSEGSPFVLRHTTHWDALADYVAAGNDCSGLYFKLGSNLKVTKRIGAAGHPFSGTFSGSYAVENPTPPRYIPYVLSVDIDGGSDEFVAPFAYIQGATIKDLSVTGSVKGSMHSAGLVGNIVNGDINNFIINCRVATTVTTTDQYAGGVVGHGHAAKVDVDGCLFEGTIKRESSGGRYAGAIMGWCDNKTNINILDCVEKGTYTNFSYTQLNYCYSGSATPFAGDNCFNFHNWSVGKKAFEITLDDDDVLKPVTEEHVYRASSLIKYNGGAMSYLPEAEDDDDLMVFAAKDDTFSFELTSGTFNGVKDEDSNNVECTGAGTTVNPYQFTMPAKSVTVSADEGTAYALLIGTTKLVFAYSKSTLTVGESFESYGTITELWSGDAVIKSGWSAPGWYKESDNNVTEVVFDETFAQVKPTSFFWWFCKFQKLTTITDIQYLNTSEATTMNSMFYNCFVLPSINVNGFDVSKVTNVTTMFSGCSALTTITCSNSWNIAESSNMFSSCTKLKNYDPNRVDGTMANPATGYFTPGATPVVIPGSGTMYDPYRIGTLSQWNKFAENVNGGDNYSGKYVKLTADIENITTMIGTAENAFAGHFDGDGHVLTVNITSGDLYAAPFRHVYGWIDNLSVSGTITTSNKHAGGIVGLATYLELRNCASDVAINSSVDGDGSHGGLVGLIQNPKYATIGYGYSVEGCRFSGKLLGGSTTHCSGLVGYTDIRGVGLTVEKCLFAPAEVTGCATDSKTIARYDGEKTAGQFVNVSDCYYTQTLGTVDEGATQVYEITDETESVMPYNSTAYGASGLTIGSDMLLVLTDGYKCYGVGGETVKFTCPVSVTVTKTTGGAAIEKTGSGTDQSPYQFTMPAEAVTLTGDGAKAYAIWCGGESDKVLYFVYTDVSGVAPGGTWDGKTITQVWSGEAVTNTGWSTPGWNASVSGNATTVVFDPSFAEVKPNSLFKWFCYFEKLESIEGLQYLNTSEVTTMNSTFYDCYILTAVDVSGFDMSKVTNTNSMFQLCVNLKTIYCANSWTVGESNNMFIGCSKLVGAVSYQDSKDDISMANPYTGYFTKKYLELKDNENNTTTITTNNGIANLEVTLSGRTFKKNNQWNTVCLPFDLNGETFISSPFVDAIAIKELDVENKYKYEGGNWVVDNEDGTDQTGFDEGTGVLTLFLKDVFFDDDTTDDEYVDHQGMKAGMPYLVKWAEDTDITDPVFPGVTIDKTAPTPVTSYDEHVSFQGVYGPTPLTPNDKSNRYLSGSTLYWPNAAVTVNAFRNYFHLSPLAAVGVRSLRMESGDEGETTAIEAISIDPTATANPAEATDNTYYNLNGQRVTTPTKGIYIHNGRKVIIK